MTIFQKIDLKKLNVQQKNYQWEKIDECPHCHSNKVWGHGYVYRYFDSYPSPLPIKRWRCPNCSSIFTARPLSHWRRIQAPTYQIYKALRERLRTLRWPSWISRQRGGAWLKKFINYIQLHNVLKNRTILENLIYFQEKKLVFI